MFFNVFRKKFIQSEIIFSGTYGNKSHLSTGKKFNVWTLATHYGTTALKGRLSRAPAKDEKKYVGVSKKNWENSLPLIDGGDNVKVMERECET